MAELQIDTGGGAYFQHDVVVHGDIVGRDNVTNFNVTIGVFPGSDLSLLEAYGLEKIIPKQPTTPIPRESNVLISKDRPNGKGSSAYAELPLDVGRHWILNKPTAFDNHFWFVAGNALLVPTVAGITFLLRAFGVSKTYDFSIRLTRGGQLEARIWDDAGSFVPVVNTPNDVPWSGISREHTWSFEQFEPTVVLSVGGAQPTVISFDPELAQTVWRIRHLRPTRRTQSYIIVLKRET